MYHYVRHYLGLVGCVGAWGVGLWGWGGCHGLRRGVFGLARGCWACAGWVLGKWFLGFGVGQGGLAGWWVGF